jgi:hypothetical protein
MTTEEGDVAKCSMRGSNPRPLAHKTNTLPTELMEQHDLTSVDK